MTCSDEVHINVANMTIDIGSNFAFPPGNESVSPSFIKLKGFRRIFRKLVAVVIYRKQL